MIWYLLCIRKISWNELVVASLAAIVAQVIDCRHEQMSQDCGQSLHSLFLPSFFLSYELWVPPIIFLSEGIRSSSRLKHMDSVFTDRFDAEGVGADAILTILLCGEDWTQSIRHRYNKELQGDKLIFSIHRAVGSCTFSQCKCITQ